MGPRKLKMVPIGPKIAPKGQTGSKIVQDDLRMACKSSMMVPRWFNMVPKKTKNEVRWFKVLQTPHKNQYETFRAKSCLRLVLSRPKAA